MININNKEVSTITIGGKEVALITIDGKTAYQKNLDPFVFTNTVITNVGNNKAQLTSDVQVNYTGTWDDGYFEVYNELDKNRSIHFSPSDISNGVLTASNLISESNVDVLYSPATVTIYNSGTALWTGSVSFTVVQ